MTAFTEADADGFRRCGRDDDHDPHAWASWFHYERGTVISGRDVERLYWCDGLPDSDPPRHRA